MIVFSRAYRYETERPAAGYCPRRPAHIENNRISTSLLSCFFLVQFFSGVGLIRTGVGLQRVVDACSSAFWRHALCSLFIGMCVTELEVFS